MGVQTRWCFSGFIYMATKALNSKRRTLAIALKRPLRDRTAFITLWSSIKYRNAKLSCYCAPPRILIINIFRQKRTCPNKNNIKVNKCNYIIGRIHSAQVLYVYCGWVGRSPKVALGSLKVIQSVSQVHHWMGNKVLKELTRWHDRLGNESVFHLPRDSIN